MSESPAQPAGGLLPGIEALRGVAALTVVFHHCWSLADSPRVWGSWILGGFGSFGVDVFFLLSGFLLADYFWRPREKRSILQYARRRFFRIAPAYYVVITVLFLFFASHALLFSSFGLRQVIASATFTHYWFPSTSSSLNVDGALWTMSIEACLYAAMPVLALLVGRWPKAALTAIVGGGLGYRLFVARAGADLAGRVFHANAGVPVQIQRLFLARQFPGVLAIFGLGIGLKWAHTRGLLPRGLRPPVRRPNAAVLLLALAPSLLWLRMADRSVDYHRWIWFTGWDFTACVLAAPALLYAARPVIGRGLGPVYRAMRWLGQRSYGLYLWHFPIILSLYGRGPLERPPDMRSWGIKVPVILALSLLAASASWRAVERPAQEFARRGSRMPTTPAVQEVAP